MEEEGLQFESELRIPDSGVSRIVRVKDPRRPWLRVEFRVVETHDDEHAFFRLADVSISTLDIVAPETVRLLCDGEWWRSMLDQVLEYCLGKSTALDGAYEEGQERYYYGWEGEDLIETLLTAVECPRTEAQTSAEEADLKADERLAFEELIARNFAEDEGTTDGPGA